MIHGGGCLAMDDDYGEEETPDVASYDILSEY
jgi:hypothetical protein